MIGDILKCGAKFDVTLPDDPGPVKTVFNLTRADKADSALRQLEHFDVLHGRSDAKTPAERGARQVEIDVNYILKYWNSATNLSTEHGDAVITDKAELERQLREVMDDDHVARLGILIQHGPDYMDRRRLENEAEIEAQRKNA